MNYKKEKLKSHRWRRRRRQHRQRRRRRRWTFDIQKMHSMLIFKLDQRGENPLNKLSFSAAWTTEYHLACTLPPSM